MHLRCETSKSYSTMRCCMPSNCSKTRPRRKTCWQKPIPSPAGPSLTMSWLQSCRLRDCGRLHGLGREVVARAAAADEVVPKVSDLDALAARLALDDLFAEAFNVPLAAAASGAELDALLVPLPDNAPIDAVALLLAIPVRSVARCCWQREELLFRRIAADRAVPFGPAAARLPVRFEGDVSLL